MSSAPRFEVRSADWLTAPEAQRRILEHAEPLPPLRVALGDALGRALADGWVSSVTLPPWDNAAMDGYAVRGADIASAAPESPAVLQVVGVSHAGAPASPRVGPREAVRIMTGAPVPEGADSVIRVEDTDAEQVPGTVSVLRTRDRDRNIRPAGQDLRPGDRVLEPGDTIHAGTVGLLAALGAQEVLVHGAPRVAILVTGDELRDASRYDDVRGGLGIPESNGPMLAAAIVEAGGVPLHLGATPDSSEALADAVRRAAEADVLVTVGGAALGEADLVKRVLDQEGFRSDFWRVRMRPGSPFGFGWLTRGDRAQPVFGLPGNPASAFVTFEVFVRPFLRRLGGHAAPHRLRLTCRAGEPFAGGGRALFLRVQVDGSSSPPTVRTTGPQSSGLVRGLAAAQGLAIIPKGASVAQGGDVEVILLDGGATQGASPLEGIPL